MRVLAGQWLGRFGPRRRRTMAVPRPLVASRDLPPPVGFASSALPRSPEPMPEEALVFAQEAATRRRAPAPSCDAPSGNAVPGPGSPALSSIATGADLRALLERFERTTRRRQALDQGAQARNRLVERLAAGRALPAIRPTLRLVSGAADTCDRVSTARRHAEEAQRIDRAMDEALVSALGTLRRLRALARD